MSDKVSNWLSISLGQMWPVMIGIIGIAMFLAQMNTKLDNLIALESKNNAEFLSWKSNIESRFGDLALDVKGLKVIHGIVIK